MLLFGSAFLSLCAAMGRRTSPTQCTRALCRVLGPDSPDEGPRDCSVSRFSRARRSSDFLRSGSQARAEMRVSYVALLTTLAESARRRLGVSGYSAVSGCHIHCRRVRYAGVEVLCLRPCSAGVLVFRSFLHQIRNAVSVGGRGLWFYYGASLCGALGCMALTPLLSRSATQPTVFRAWALAWFALFAMTSSALFAFSSNRSDLSTSPFCSLPCLCALPSRAHFESWWGQVRLFDIPAGATISVLLVLSLRGFPLRPAGEFSRR